MNERALMLYFLALKAIKNGADRGQVVALLERMADEKGRKA